MKKSKFIKGLTLLSFVFFITFFLLYRVGKFDSYLSNKNPSLQASPNGGAINSMLIDTLPKIDSSERVMLSSTKSVIVINLKKYSFFDTLKKKKPRVVYVDPTKTKEVRMSSSKSGKIFSPIEPPFTYVPVYIDSITYDTLTRKFKKRQ